MRIAVSCTLNLIRTKAAYTHADNLVANVVDKLEVRVRVRLGLQFTIWSGVLNLVHWLEIDEPRQSLPESADACYMTTALVLVLNPVPYPGINPIGRLL